MIAEEECVKVVFPLEQDEDGYPPATSESLWAKRIGQDLFQLDNIPFYAFGVALGDVVRACKLSSDTYEFIEVTQPSGNSTLRLLCRNVDETESIRDEFRAKGCESEGSGIPGLIAVNVPAAVARTKVWPVVEKGAAKGRWGYEEASISAT